MTKTVQIRNIDDATYAGLRRRAAAVGLSVPGFLRREVERLAQEPSLEEWVERTRRRRSSMTTTEVVETLDEMRGPWPDARS